MCFVLAALLAAGACKKDEPASKVSPDGDGEETATQPAPADSPAPRERPRLPEAEAEAIAEKAAKAAGIDRQRADPEAPADAPAPRGMRPDPAVLEAARAAGRRGLDQGDAPGGAAEETPEPSAGERCVQRCLRRNQMRAVAAETLRADCESQCAGR